MPDLRLGEQIMRRIIGGAIAIGLAAVVGAQAEPPAGWDAAVIDACESAADFEAGPGGKLSTTDAVKHTGRSVVWSFAAGEGVDELRLAHAPGPLKGRGAVGLWVKNPEDCARDVRLQVIDGEGRAFASERTPIDDSRAWRALLFLTDDLRPLDGADAPLQFPLRRLELIAESRAAEGTCTLYLDDLTAYLAPPEELEIVAIEAPDSVALDSVSRETSVRLTLRVRAPSRLLRNYPVTLAVSGGAAVLAESPVSFRTPTTAWPAGEEQTSEPVTLALPRFLAGGEYLLRVRAPGLALSGEAALGVPLLVEGGAAERTTVVIAEHEGAPAAMIGDTIVPLCGRLGVEGPGALLIVPATAAHDPYGGAPDVWPSRDEWDYEALDRRVIEALKARPEARLILRVFLEAPDWWDAENPNELILFSHGRHAVRVDGLRTEETFASLASTKWRTDAQEAMRRFVAHVEQSPYAERVIGYQLAGGEDGRWRYWGAAEGLYADYSRPQRRAFTAWLREKYGDVRTLRVKWQEIVNPIPGLAGEEPPIPTVLSWDDVRVPSGEARAAHPSGAVLDPAAAPEVADYNLFHAEEVAGFICELAAAAKSASEGRKLVGVSYGHFLEHVRSPAALPNAGHLALDRVLTSAEIDLVAAPFLAPEGEAGRGLSLPAAVVASVKAHGKVPIGEVLPMDAPLDPTLAAAQMEALGGALWYGGAEPWEPPPATAGDRASVAEIALILDHFSLAYLAEGKALSQPLLAGQWDSLGRLGAPCDAWLLDDLIAGRVPDYKLYLFPNAFYLDQEAREAVRKHVARDGKTAVWVYAPGAMEETLSGPTALELTDLALGFVAREAPLRVR
ncbi:MAG: hypothetical protein FJX74_03330, partial [Armatimonadetes bacterium]|nr:hypothetical protein [Armatimonadota bacterium]